MKGFTLLEILLSVAAITIISGMSIPVYQSFQVKDALDIAVVSTAQSLRRAQNLSFASDGDSSWGTKIASGSITVFKGASFDSREASFDEVFDVPTSISPSGVGEIVFNKLTGEPQTVGAIVFTSSINETATLTINGKGMVDY